MSFDEINSVTGFLLSWEKTISKQKLLECSQMSFDGKIDSSNWEKYTYKSEKPLLKEDEQSLFPPYKYSIICRRSGSRILFLSSSRIVVEYIIEKEFSIIFMPYLRKINIIVDSLVRDLTLTPNKYVLSFIHARVPTYGALLRSVSFYGDDLGEAGLFRDNIEIMNFFTCGLRLAVGGTEIVRLGSEGSVSFLMTDSRKLLEVENVLSFLREKEYFDDTYKTNEIGG